jgi:hypothetical protein
MSRIVKEWVCLAHGPFENATGKCKHGCSKRFVTQEFRTPIAIRHGSTTQADGTARSLAQSYNMTDIPTTRDGESVMQALRRTRDTRHYAPSWGHVEHAPPGWSQREGEKPPTVSAAQYGAVPENQLAPLQSSLAPPKPLVPKGGHYTAPLPE